MPDILDDDDTFLERVEADPSPFAYTRRFRPVVVRERHDGWSPAKQADFVTALGEAGCVADACRAVGMSKESAYRLRARPDATDFRMAWQAALDYAVQKLDDAVLSRAINGVAVPHYYKGQLVGEHRRYDERLAQFLLRYRRPLTYARHWDKMDVVAGHHEDEAERFAAGVDVVRRDVTRDRLEEEAVARRDAHATRMEENAIAYAERPDADENEAELRVREAWATRRDADAAAAARLEALRPRIAEQLRWLEGEVSPPDVAGLSSTSAAVPADGGRQPARAVDGVGLAEAGGDRRPAQTGDDRRPVEADGEPRPAGTERRPVTTITMTEAEDGTEIWSWNVDEPAEPAADRPAHGAAVPARLDAGAIETKAATRGMAGGGRRDGGRTAPIAAPRREPGGTAVAGGHGAG